MVDNLFISSLILPLKVEIIFLNYFNNIIRYINSNILNIHIIIYVFQIHTVFVGNSAFSMEKKKF